MSRAGIIGVFDSGAGGLSVLSPLRARLPAENFLYIADSRHIPYGNKPPEYIERRALTLADFARARGAKVLVVACNTATAAAVAALRAHYEIPVIGIEPGIKPAVEQSRRGVVGVLATAGTLASDKFVRLKARFHHGVEVIEQPCPGFVEQVERGDLTGDGARVLVEKYVRPLVARGADVLVLGCTHYPYLAPLIREVAGPGVEVIDTGPAVAREVARRLEEKDLLAPNHGAGAVEFWTSGEAREVRPLLCRLWGAEVEISLLPEEYR